MRSPLGRAIGLGSAKEGVEHWWAQRVTAIALVPLVLWFVIAVIGLAGADVDDRRIGSANPMPAVLLVLLLIATFYHAALGLQVVIEDYVHSEPASSACLIVMRLACYRFSPCAAFSPCSSWRSEPRANCRSL